MSIMHEFGPSRTLTSEEKREKKLAEEPSPATCLVPFRRKDIVYHDWLLYFLDEHEFECGLIFTITGVISFIAGGTILGTNLEGAGSLTGTPLVVICALAAYLIGGAYAMMLTYGQDTGSTFMTSWSVSSRVRRIHRKEMRRATRQVRRLDAKGWRPREGIPHPKGRDDTYNRWLVEGHCIDNELALGLREWVYAEEESAWRAGKMISVSWFQNDGEGLIEMTSYRAQLEAEARTLGSQAENELTESRSARQIASEKTQQIQPVIAHLNQGALPIE